MLPLVAHGAAQYLIIQHIQHAHRCSINPRSQQEAYDWSKCPCRLEFGPIYSNTPKSKMIHDYSLAFFPRRQKAYYISWRNPSVCLNMDLYFLLLNKFFYTNCFDIFSTFKYQVHTMPAPINNAACFKASLKKSKIIIQGFKIHFAWNPKLKGINIRFRLGLFLKFAHQMTNGLYHYKPLGEVAASIRGRIIFH